MISALARLKKRSPARNVAETGTLEDEAEKLAKQVQEEKGRLTRKRVEKYVHDEEKLRIFDYMLEVPEGPGGDKETEVGSSRSCDRCKKDFIVKADLEEVRFLFPAPSSRSLLRPLPPSSSALLSRRLHTG